MGGPQSFPFILVPSEWAVLNQTIVGAESTHQWLRRWLKDLGHPEYMERRRALRYQRAEPALAASCAPTPTKRSQAPVTMKMKDDIMPRPTT